MQYAPMYVRQALARNVYKHMTEDEAMTYIHTEYSLYRGESDRWQPIGPEDHRADQRAMEPWDIMASALGLPYLV